MEGSVGMLDLTGERAEAYKRAYMTNINDQMNIRDMKRDQFNKIIFDATKIEEKNAELLQAQKEMLLKVD